MDQISDMSDFAKEDVCIKGTDIGKMSSMVPGTIEVDPQYMSSLLLNEELKAALNKRFKDKRTVYLNPDFSSLVLWCLSTNSYSVNDKNLYNVDIRDVDSCWQFIDTMKVSSSDDCRELIARGSDGRDSLGFRRRTAPPGSNTRTNREPFNNQAVRIFSYLKKEDGHDSYRREHLYVEDIMAEDICKIYSELGDISSATRLFR